MTMIIDDPSRW